MSIHDNGQFNEVPQRKESRIYGVKRRITGMIKEEWRREKKEDSKDCEKEEHRQSTQEQNLNILRQETQEQN